MIYFDAEHRANGLTYVTVLWSDEQGTRPAGNFSLPTDAWKPLAAALSGLPDLRMVSQESSANEN